jgi:hypothetical protein
VESNGLSSNRGDAQTRLIAWKPRFTDPRVASTRLRCFTIMSGLRRQGYPCELFEPSRADRYALVVYAKRYDDESCQEARRLKERGTRVVLDLCDNHFFNPSDLPKYREIGGQLHRMLGVVDHVVASTEALAEVLRQEFPAMPPLAVIGDPAEERLDPALSPWRERLEGRWQLYRLIRTLGAGKRRGRSAIVWFGVHGVSNAEAGMQDLLRLRGCLEGLDRRFPLSLTVISNSMPRFDDIVRPWAVPTRYLEWAPATFFKALGAHDLAVIPITPNAFTRCKTNNRVVTALRAGLAVVADSIPSYEEFRGVIRLDEWEQGLVDYLSSPQRRRQDVVAGRAMIAERWSADVVCGRWRSLFEEMGVGIRPVATG